MSSKNIFQQAILSRKKSKRNKLLFGIIWLALIIMGLFYLQISITDLIVAIPEFLIFLFTEFFPPNFSGFTGYIDDLLQTVTFAFIAMITSMIISLILSFFMAKNINPIEPIRFVIRAFVSLLRNIPTIIWGSVLVYIFGIGAVAGVMALTFSMTGLLTKTYADTIEEIAGESLEAMEANGATTIQKIVHGIIPQFIPSWLNWTLFSFEIGVRASSILGLVGAGGIGVIIQTRISLFEYQEAMALVLYIIILVLFVEFFTNALRRRIR